MLLRMGDELAKTRCNVTVVQNSRVHKSAETENQRYGMSEWKRVWEKAEHSTAHTQKWRHFIETDMTWLSQRQQHANTFYQMENYENVKCHPHFARWYSFSKKWKFFMKYLFDMYLDKIVDVILHIYLDTQTTTTTVQAGCCPHFCLLSTSHSFSLTMYSETGRRQCVL